MSKRDIHRGLKSDNLWRRKFITQCSDFRLSVHLVLSPTYALIYIIKILTQAITLVALFTPTCFDPYGSSSGVLLALAKLLIKIIKL